MGVQGSGLSSQIGKLDSAVQSASGLEAYPLWVRLVGVLDSMCQSLDVITTAVRGDGNGEDGLLRRVTTVEDGNKAMQSDIHEIKSMVRILAGLGHDAEPLENIERWNAVNHPARRVEDKQGTADKVLSFFVKQVLPGIIISLVMMFIMFQIALNTHLIQDVIGTPLP